jgi:hypothetical protein
MEGGTKTLGWSTPLSVEAVNTGVPLILGITMSSLEIW